MSQLECKLDLPEGPLTVGQEFHVLCEGTWSPLDREKLELQLAQADKYKLKILEIQEVSASKMVIKVTSYVTGEHKLGAVTLVQGEQRLVLGDLNFTVQSSLNPQQPETEPFGPMGPISFGKPFWYWGLWVIAVLAIAFWIWRVIRRRLQRQKLLEELSMHDSSLPPYHQFNLQARQLQKKYAFLSQPELPVSQEPYQCMKELDQAYRVFLGRLLRVPALQWGHKLILSDIKRYHRELYRQIKDEMQKHFAEMQRALTAAERLPAQDAIQLFQMTRKLADKIHQIKTQQVGS